MGMPLLQSSLKQRMRHGVFSVAGQLWGMSSDCSVLSVTTEMHLLYSPIPPSLQFNHCSWCLSLGYSQSDPLPHCSMAYLNVSLTVYKLYWAKRFNCLMVCGMCVEMCVEMGLGGVL